MKIRFKITKVRNIVYYFQGCNGKNKIRFSVSFNVKEKYPYISPSEYIKNWKVFRYFMRIDELKRKIWEENK